MTIRKRMTAVSIALGVFAFGMWFWPHGATSPTLAQDKGSERESAFEKTIRPLLREHCLRCHSTKRHKGDLDLERFATVASIKQHTDVWEHVLDQLATGEMPPKSSRQLSGEQKQQLTKWIREAIACIMGKLSRSNLSAADGKRHAKSLMDAYRRLKKLE